MEKAIWAGIIEGVLLIEHFEDPPRTKLTPLGGNACAVVDRMEFEKMILRAPADATQAHLLRLATAESIQGEELFNAKPVRWHAADPSKWRCVKNHVSSGRPSEDEVGRGVCPVCTATAYLTFPEDVDGPLSVSV